MKKINWKKVGGFKAIAQAVKDAREKAGLSQEKLAKQLGYKHGQFINNIEKGKCSLPHAKLRKFIELTECNPEKMIDALEKDYSFRVRYVFIESGGENV